MPGSTGVEHVYARDCHAANSKSTGTKGGQGIAAPQRVPAGTNTSSVIDHQGVPEARTDLGDDLDYGSLTSRPP